MVCWIARHLNSSKQLVDLATATSNRSYAVFLNLKRFQNDNHISQLSTELKDCFIMLLPSTLEEIVLHIF